MADSEGTSTKALAGSQTLVRGLDVLAAVADGAVTLPQLSGALGLTRSTCHRLAATLVEQRFLNFTPKVGYSLGPRLIELGYKAGQQVSLTRIAAPHLMRLAADTGDTVHLGVLDGDRALYLDKHSGSRRIEISSRIGERQPLRSTGLGKALILEENDSRLMTIYDQEARDFGKYLYDRDQWLSMMHDYARQGYAFDLEENEDRIRCVAAPIRNVTGRIIAAISVSGAAQYMDNARMEKLTLSVMATTQQISRELGWSGN